MARIVGLMYCAYVAGLAPKLPSATEWTPVMNMLMSAIWTTSMYGSEQRIVAAMPQPITVVRMLNCQ